MKRNKDTKAAKQSKPNSKKRIPSVGVKPLVRPKPDRTYKRLLNIIIERTQHISEVFVWEIPHALREFVDAIEKEPPIRKTPALALTQSAGNFVRPARLISCLYLFYADHCPIVTVPSTARSLNA